MIVQLEFQMVCVTSPYFCRKDVSLGPPPPSSLALPFSYKQLEDIFYCADTVLSMLDKRNEVCTFSKLKSAVEQMRKKSVFCCMPIHQHIIFFIFVPGILN
jgi:hypothetical protein